jgi:hypothetical protein
MKTTNMIAILAGLAVSVITSSAQTQVKGAQLMLQRSGGSTIATAPSSDSKPMSCAKCQDVFITVPDSAAKGGSRLTSQGLPAKTVVSHLCGGCNTTTVKVGLGKQAKEVATHACASCGSEQMNCCNTTKDSTGATKGMDGMDGMKGMGK